jgi:hypothetical protein
MVPSVTVSPPASMRPYAIALSGRPRVIGRRFERTGSTHGLKHTRYLHANLLS